MPTELLHEDKEPGWYSKARKPTNNCDLFFYQLKERLLPITYNLASRIWRLLKDLFVQENEIWGQMIPFESELGPIIFWIDLVTVQGFFIQLVLLLCS